MYNIKIKITKKLQTRITVTLNHTPDRPTDRPPHVSTCVHTFALLGCEHVLIWGGRSFGRSGVWLSVTVILVCNFLVIYFLSIFFLKIGGAAPPLSPLLLFSFFFFFFFLWGRGGRGGNTAMTNPPLSLETTVNIFVGRALMVEKYGYSMECIATE